MKYIHWGKKEDSPLVSRLGFGTTRFLKKDLNTAEGIENCVKLVKHAINRGINYFDVSPTYSNGMAEKILGEAFRDSKEKLYISAKSGLTIDRTSDDILRRIERSLFLLNRNKIDFYHIWSVFNWEQYQETIRSGGIYEGVLQAKKQGLVNRICISLHCDPQTTLRILSEDRFEGIIISLNALNYEKWLPVLKAASEKKIAVVTMNSLAGGLIPRYESLFFGLDKSSDSAAVKALRFVLQLHGVDVALSGMSTIAEVDENCSAADSLDSVTCAEKFSLPVKDSLCSGCNYCAPCTVGIPIAACMQAYNHKILVDSLGMPKNDIDIVNEVFTRVRANGTFFPDLNRCIACRVCEKRCTQKIKISERMQYLSQKADQYGYNNEIIAARLKSILTACESNEKIAIWPASDYASMTLDILKKITKINIEDKCVFVNVSPAMWGRKFRGKIIISPAQMENENIDAIIIMHRRLQNEIKQELVSKYGNKYDIICLHENNDIDYFNQVI